jgi:hypothetical protein
MVQKEMELRMMHSCSKGTRPPARGAYDFKHTWLRLACCICLLVMISEMHAARLCALLMDVWQPQRQPQQIKGWPHKHISTCILPSTVRGEISLPVPVESHL